MTDKQTTLQFVEGRIGVDTFNADGVWFSLNVKQASIYLVITPDETRALIEALYKVIS